MTGAQNVLCSFSSSSQLLRHCPACLFILVIPTTTRANSFAILLEVFGVVLLTMGFRFLTVQLFIQSLSIISMCCSDFFLRLFANFSRFCISHHHVISALSVKLLLFCGRFSFLMFLVSVQGFEFFRCSFVSVRIYRSDCYLSVACYIDPQVGTFHYLLSYSSL